MNVNRYLEENHKSHLFLMQSAVQLRAGGCRPQCDRELCESRLAAQNLCDSPILSAVCTSRSIRIFFLILLLFFPTIMLFLTIFICSSRCLSIFSVLQADDPRRGREPSLETYSKCFSRMSKCMTDKVACLLEPKDLLADI